MVARGLARNSDQGIVAFSLMISKSRNQDYIDHSKSTAQCLSNMAVRDDGQIFPVRHDTANRF